MTDLYDIVNAARPAPTDSQIWKARQKRMFIVFICIGGTLFVAGLGWLSRQDRNAAPGLWAIFLGLAFIMVAAWFGLRALMTEPNTA